MEPIPWYKSQVLRALMVGFVAFALKKAGLADQFPNTDGIVDMILDAIQFGAGLWVAYARIRKPNPPVTMSAAPPVDSGKLQSLAAVLCSVALAVVMCSGLAGCESLGLQKGQTAEQRAAALLGDFNLYQRASLQVGNDATVVPEVRKAVLDAAIAAKPAADSLDAALLDYRSIKQQLEAGTGRAARKLGTYRRRSIVGGKGEVEAPGAVAKK
jgi:hypothetical protein